MSEPALKCENNERYFQANLYFRTVYFILKWPIIAISAKGEIQIFQNSFKKRFITSSTGTSPVIYSGSNLAATTYWE